MYWSKQKISNRRANAMISHEEVIHIAKLARIKLTEEEISKFQADLASVLDYFGVLQEIDVSDVRSMTHSVVLENVKRKDAAKEKRGREANRLLEMAPNADHGYLKVKSIL